MVKKDIDKVLLENCINKFKTKADILRELDITDYNFEWLLKKYNLSFMSSHIKGKSKYDFITKEWLINNWINTDKSITELSKEFNIPVGALEERYIKYNIHKNFKYHINTTKLFDLSDIRVWYLAGLIVTDGYIPKGQNAVDIDLTGESEYKLLEEMYSTYGGVLKQYGKSFRWRFATEGLNGFLSINFNITDGAKTFSAKVPDIFPSEDCAKAYVRGCMDGDGYIGKNGNSFSILTASDNLIYGLQNIIYKYTGINVPITYTKSDGKKYPNLSCTDKKSRDILKWIYSVENCFKLERKYKNYLNYYKNVDDIVWTTSNTK